jgi:hypothetical protein
MKSLIGILNTEFPSQLRACSHSHDIHMEVESDIVITRFPFHTITTSRKNNLVSTSPKHFPTCKYNLGNYNHAQGNRISQTIFQLYLYGYHPPLDVNPTHWASRSAPTLPLPHIGPTLSQPFYLNFNNLMYITISTIPLKPNCNFELCYLLSILVHKSRVPLGQDQS